jgi:hypothetical protein
MRAVTGKCRLRDCGRHVNTFVTIIGSTGVLSGVRTSDGHAGTCCGFSVPRRSTAALTIGLLLVACLSMTCGLVLDTVTRGRREIKRLAYLSHQTSRPGLPATISRMADAMAQYNVARKASARGHP